MSLIDDLEASIPNLKIQPRTRVQFVSQKIARLNVEASSRRLPRWQRELYAYEASDYKRLKSRQPSLPRIVIGGEVIGG